MKHKTFKYSSVMVAITLCAMMTACNNDEEPARVKETTQQTAIAELNNELSALNATYRDDSTRMPKWLRRILVCAADVVGYVLKFDVGKAAALSTALSNVFDENGGNSASFSSQDDNSHFWVGGQGMYAGIDNTSHGPVSGLPSIGLDHNDIIMSTDMDICLAGYDYTKEIDKVLDKAMDKFSFVYTIDDRSEVKTIAKQMVDYYKTDMTVTEYIDELKSLTNDQDTKDVMDACGIVLEGLQYVDNSDTTYISNVVRLVNKSQLKPDMKTTLLNAVSIADASACLWNGGIVLGDTIGYE